ncbi:MAG: hypothetical protein ABW174_16390 [Flavitalea sp.]
MKISLNQLKLAVLGSAFGLMLTAPAKAQTDVDGIMMNKNNLCTGFQYGISDWDHYWEGKLKRTNENLGHITTQSVTWMGNYGISNKLNVLFSLPYVWTKASAGTLHGVNGLQDLSLMLKYKMIESKIGKGKFKLIAVGGYSMPVSDYVADFQPLAIGLGARTLTGRLLADYEYKHMFITGTAAYTYRSNIEIDRDYYYTDKPQYTNKVDMPDAMNFQVRLGYRGGMFGVEGILNNMTTLGGFDITRNNMPFPSNEMNATSAGLAFKCNPRAFPGMSLQLGGSYVLAGRNFGQALAANGGIMYVFDFNKKPKATN